VIVKEKPVWEKYESGRQNGLLIFERLLLLVRAIRKPHWCAHHNQDFKKTQRGDQWQLQLIPAERFQLPHRLEDGPDSSKITSWNRETEFFHSGHKNRSENMI
jgi:hypothetical protein